MREKEYLDPEKPLPEAVVDWLLNSRIKMMAGAVSLAHIMVVVPTAQSGRNLRLTLAKAAAKRGWGGIIPPKVQLPMQLVKPASETLPEATPIAAAIAFQQYVKTNREKIKNLNRIVGMDAFNDRTADELTARFALFDQLEEIWRILAGRGLLMRDVPVLGKAILAAAIGDEQERWEQLAKLEDGYFTYLHEHGVEYPTERVSAAKVKSAIVDDAIEEIVLPALADPVRVLGDVLEQQVAAGKRVTVLSHDRDSGLFDKWGWPKAMLGKDDPIWHKLTNDDLICATNSSELAQIAANDCPPMKAGKKLPSIVLCDDELYQGVASAFLNRGYEVHNPGRYRLAQSSLGRLVKDLMALYPEGDLPWRESLALLRSADMQSALGLTAEIRERVLIGADIAQNAFIPTIIPKGFAFPPERVIQEWQREDFSTFCEVGRRLEAMLATARADATLGTFLRRMLKTIFAAHLVGERSDEKEFFAAAEGVRDFLAAIESDFVMAFRPTKVEIEALARRALNNVVYSLEPDTQSAIKTEGWLELPWTIGEQVALIGLHEGKVPDSVVGHPFLPDALREALGLVTNEDRLVRDAWILKELLVSRSTPHSVRVYVARTNDEGDICRPSRLLYLGLDATLPERVATLFGDLPIKRENRERRTKLPITLPEEVAPPKHLSASALDTYVKCPFNYLLQCGLKMNAYQEKRELAADDFGKYIHDVLDQYAKMQIERGDSQLTNAEEIKRVIFEEIVPNCRARFVRPTLNINLQLRAANGRLALFAEKQAEWAQQGWRIRETEYVLNDPIQEFDVCIKGRIDRVDENINRDAPKHWCIIDYKTWDKKTLTWHAITSNKQTETNEKHLELARKLGFARIANGKGRECQRMLSVQLPLYGKCYAQKRPDISFADMAFSYFILGTNANETGIGDKKTLLTEEQVTASVETAKRAVALIKAGIFWPPGPTEDPMIERCETEWIKHQEQKLEAFHD